MRRRAAAAVVVAAVAVLACGPAPAAAARGAPAAVSLRAGPDPNLTPAERAADLAKQMTLDEKRAPGLKP